MENNMLCEAVSLIRLMLVTVNQAKEEILKTHPETSEPQFVNDGSEADAASVPCGI